MKQARIFIAFTFLLAFAVCVSAQSVQFPNELKGYEFFGNGKLKDLKLGVSSKEDIIKIFGEDCSKLCDYDENWQVKFIYFGKWTQTSSKKVVAVASPEYAGKLWIVRITPKNDIKYSDMSFPNIFKASWGVINGQGNLKTSLKDSIGLSYMFDSDFHGCHVKSNHFETCKPPETSLLGIIQYNVPAEIGNKAWILVKQDK